MTHLDEGTIHAWLDGALGEAEARVVREHAASCAECGALVAEARGLIAGASRILTSLDDVPSVEPKRAPAPRPAVTSPQRFWQASPWVTGIAAALILAVGVREWMDRPSARQAIAPVTPLQMDSLRAALPEQATPVDSALRARVVSAPAPRPLSAPPAADLQRLPMRLRGVSGGAGAKVADAGGVASGARVAGAPDSDARKDMTADRGKAQVAEAAAAPAAPAAPAQAAASAAQGDLDKRAAAVPMAPVSPKLLPLAAKPGPEGFELAQPVDERRLAGCYRFSEAALAQLAGEPSARSLPPTTAARGRLAPAAKASPSAAADAATGVLFAPPRMVRLDSALTPRGRLIRSVTTGEELGTWFRVPGDSVRLVMPVAGNHTLPQTSRVACPPGPQ